MNSGKVFWVDGAWPGRLGIALRPRGGEWLVDEVAAWRRAGVDVVVSLLEPSEEAQFALEGEAAAVEAAGASYRAFPIPDRGVPASRDSVAELANTIVEALERGRNVAVHCRQSVGRSGLIVGSTFLVAGTGLTQALEAITKSRGLDVPETAEQRQWLERFESWLESERAAQQAAVANSRPRTSSGAS